MSSSGHERRTRVDATSQALLLLSNRAPSRTEFLRQASALLLSGTDAHALVAWLEDGERTFVWHADPGFEPALRDEERPGRAPGGAVLERAARELDPSGALLAVGERTPRGGLSVRDLEVAPGRLAPRDGGDLVLGPSSRALVLLPFGIDEHDAGLLQLESRRPGAFSRPSVASLESLAQLLGVAVANRRAQAARAERVKELACMYRIAQLGAEEDTALPELLQQIVEVLPPAWQYPDLATARIVHAGREYRSRAFSEGPHRIASDLRVRGEAHGRVEVYYVERASPPEPSPLLEDTAFLREEQLLIDGVATAVASIIERKRAEAERARLQEQVRHADRLATIGQLAAGVAHELNEPLSNVLGFAQLALRVPELPPPVGEDLRSIVTASLHAREIIKKLMFFARRAPAQRARVELGRVVDEGMALLAARCQEAGIEVTVEGSAGVPAVLADASQLQQVLVNLVVNAIQAMPEGGRLRVATRPDGEAAALCVEDTGGGIAPEHVPRLFEPFFTTKDVGEGTGLGLAVVHGIVTAHGGAVEVESLPGRGCRFVVRLPAAGAASTMGAEP